MWAVLRGFWRMPSAKVMQTSTWALSGWNSCRVLDYMIKPMCVALLTLFFTRSVGTLQPTRSSGRVGSKFNWPSEDQCHRSHSNGFLVLSHTYTVNTVNYSSQNCLESRRSVLDDRHDGSLFWCALSNDSRRGSAGIDQSQSRCCEFFVSLIDKKKTCFNKKRDNQRVAVVQPSLSKYGTGAELHAPLWQSTGRFCGPK